MIQTLTVQDQKKVTSKDVKLSVLRIKCLVIMLALPHVQIKLYTAAFLINLSIAMIFPVSFVTMGAIGVIIAVY